MPKITQYTRENLPTQLIQGRRATAADFGGDQTGLMAQAQAGSEMAQSLNQLSSTVNDIKVKRDRMKYNEQITEFALQNEKRKLELAQMEFGDDVDFTATYDQDLQERAKALNVPGSMQDQFQNDFARMRLNFVSSGMQEQARRAGIRAKLTYEKTIESAANLVALNPDQYDVAREMVERQAQSLPNMAPEDKDVLIDGAVTKLAQARANTLIANNPQKFINDAKDGKHDNLPDIGKYISTAEKQIKSIEAQREKALRDSLEAPLKVQIQNQNQLRLMIDDPEVPEQDILTRVNQMDLDGQISDGFAAEVRRYLTQGETPARSDVEKFQAFDDLSVQMRSLYAELGADLDGKFKDRKGKVKRDAKVTINSQTMSAYQNYMTEVQRQINEGLITEKEGLALTAGVTGIIETAIQEQNIKSTGNRLKPGVQDAYGEGVSLIDTYLENTGRVNDIRLKRDLFLEFTDQLGEYQSTGNTSKDEEVIKQAVKNATKNINSRNFIGRIDDENPPNQFVQPVQSVKPEHVFESEAEMDAANLEDGTPVMVGGVRGTARR